MKIVHDSNQTSKVSLVIPAGDTLEVSDTVAAQLMASATQFKAAARPAPKRAAPAPAPVKKAAAPKADAEG